MPYNHPQRTYYHDFSHLRPDTQCPRSEETDSANSDNTHSLHVVSLNEQDSCYLYTFPLGHKALPTVVNVPRNPDSEATHAQVEEVASSPTSSIRSDSFFDEQTNTSDTSSTDGYCSGDDERFDPKLRTRKGPEKKGTYAINLAFNNADIGTWVLLSLLTSN